MILNAVVHGKYRYGETSDRVESLIHAVMHDLAPGDPWRDMRPGEDAYLMLAEGKHDEETFDWFPHNYLQVVANQCTGFGAVSWFVTDEWPSQGADPVADHAWVSLNADSPEDPKVIGDPGYPRWYHPRHAIPLEQVEAAVREFCRRGTGDRPECLFWAEVSDGSLLTSPQYRAMYRHAA